MTTPWFNGVDTPFTGHNLVLMLGLITVYALLTGWISLLGLRLLRPLVDGVGKQLLFTRGLFPALLWVGGFLLYAFGGETTRAILLVVFPILLILNWLGYAQAFLLVPLLGIVFLGAQWLLWDWFATWTGIGWMGFPGYVILVVASWRFYPAPAH